MIKPIEDNSVFEVIKLMNENVAKHNAVGYKRNEAAWIAFFLDVVKKQKDGDPNYFAVGEYKDNKLIGFLLATTFNSYYNGVTTMDVKDCIMHESLSTPFTVTKLFDAMIAHTKTHGGTRWRADSIRSEHNSHQYAKLLNVKYGAELYFSVHGEINMDKNKKEVEQHG